MTLAMTSGLATAVNDKTRRHSNCPYGNKNKLTSQSVSPIFILARFFLSFSPGLAAGTSMKIRLIPPRSTLAI